MIKSKINLILFISVLFISVFAIKVIFYNNKSNLFMLDEVTLREYINNSDGLFAIMVENDDGEYVEYDGNSFPTSMAYNSKLSGCIDSDGNTLDAVLSFNSVTSSATVNTSKTAYCYLYFDIGTTLANAILLAENNSSTVSEAVSYISSKGDPDFTTSSTTDEGLYAAEDDYGTSYYFRGAVEDNYVYFAGFYWRIVRVNGDGSVRLIYDGTEAYENGEGGANSTIGSSVYYTNFYTKYEAHNVNSNAEVGYMHGDISYVENHTTTVKSFSSISSSYYFGTSYTFDSNYGIYKLSDYSTAYSSYSGLSGYYMCAGSSIYCSTLYYIYSVGTSTASAYTYTAESTNTYAEEHENKNDSVIKTVVDDWYASNIYNISDGNGNSYSDYISDTLFCNDRSFASSNTGTGTGHSGTQYGAYDRFKVESNNFVYTFPNSPILTCPQLNDAFTVDDTTYGNGALTYPVALITADEVVMAGGLFTGYGNYYSYMASQYGNTFPDLSKYYLDISTSFFTMTPYTGDVLPVILYDFSPYGLYSYTTYTLDSQGVRPVINLSSSVIVTGGDGTIDSPYTVALS